MRVADLHAHYPMHLLSGDGQPKLARAVRPRPSPAEGARKAVMWVANRLVNFRTTKSGPAVTVERLQAGGVGLTLSVLYEPFSEFDLDEPYGAPPGPGYARNLLAQLDCVEADLRGRQGVTVVRGAGDLARALAAGHVAIVHAVEGGFHLGATAEEVDRTVAELARRGVAYVTLAHLFFRGVATNAPAVPFLSDGAYDALFPQRGPGLTRLGEAAVRAMEREHVLVDVSHMRRDALAATLRLLDRDTPVIASHAGARLGRASYLLADATVREIARRDGVVGLIFSQRLLTDGVRRRPPRTFEQSFEVLCRHLDHLRAVTGCHAHSALGTDLDGFIRPVLKGLESSADLARLGPALSARYGAAAAAAILHGNAERVVERALAAR